MYLKQDKVVTSMKYVWKVHSVSILSSTSGHNSFMNTKIMATISSPTKKLTPFLTIIKLGVALPNHKKIYIDSKMNAKLVLN